MSSDLHAYGELAAACTRCRLAEGRTQVVFGSGDPNADLMFVGEAPGFHEDRQGVPFVGQAGKLLERLLEGIGLSRSDVYIANVFKCRPPGNRDPQPDEIEACEPHLFRQIELIEPRVVATLGNFATKLLSGRPLGITRVHGQEQEVTLGARSVLLYPIYHPAAALYTPAMLKVLESDFARIPALLDAASVAPPGAAPFEVERAGVARRVGRPARALLTDAELLARQEALQAEARPFLGEHRVVERLEAAGPVVLVGSYVTGLMVWRDLDVCVDARGLGRRPRRGASSSRRPRRRPGSVRAAGGTGRPAPLFVVGLGGWKLDLSLFTAGIPPGVATFQADLLSRLDAETRLAILRLKELWHTRRSTRSVSAASRSARRCWTGCGRPRSSRTQRFRDRGLVWAP